MPSGDCKMLIGVDIASFLLSSSSSALSMPLTYPAIMAIVGVIGNSILVVVIVTEIVLLSAICHGNGNGGRMMTMAME